jgi:hypothetical protein
MNKKTKEGGRDKLAKAFAISISVIGILVSLIT